MVLLYLRRSSLSIRFIFNAYELVNKYIKLDCDKTIEQIINEFLGNTSGSLVDYLKSDLFRKANLFETINKLLKNNMKIEIDFVSYIKMALEAIDEYKRLYNQRLHRNGWSKY